MNTLVLAIYECCLCYLLLPLEGPPLIAFVLLVPPPRLLAIADKDPEKGVVDEEPKGEGLALEEEAEEFDPPPPPPRPPE